MAKTGRLAILDGVKGNFEIKTHELPKVEPGTCLIKTELTGVCATDVHYWMGFKPTYDQTFPALYGHEFCGTIVELGDGYEKDFLGRPLKVGDRIIVKPQQQCGKCYWCTTAKVPMKCESAKSYGDTGYRAPWFLGGFAEYVYLCYPKGEVFKTELEPETAMMLEPLSIAVNTINAANQRIGDTVVVQGAGPIGLLTLACAKYYGAAKAILVGGPAERLELAREFGADLTIDIGDVKDPQKRINMVLNETDNRRGADVVYECAGFPNAVPEGIDYLRFGGTYAEAGHFANAGEIAMNPALHFCSKCIKLVGTWASTTEHFVQALAIMESRRIPIHKLITHKVPLERLKEAFQAVSTNYMLDGRYVLKIGLDPWMK